MVRSVIVKIVSKKVNGSSAGIIGSRKLKSYLIARPNEVHEFLIEMLLILRTVAHRGLKKYSVKTVGVVIIPYSFHFRIL
jgi:hypothetical protein